MQRLTANDMARVNAQAVTYYNMEPETLHDVIATANLNYERLQREAEDLKQQASEKIKAAKEAQIMLQAALKAQQHQQRQ